MRNLYLTTTFLFFSSLVLLAQNPKDNLIKQISTLKDGRIQLVEKNEKGDTVITGYLSSINPAIRNGEFSFYGNNRILEAKGNYLGDVPSGIWYYFDKKGNITKTVNYDKTTEFLRTDTATFKEIFLVVEQMPYFEDNSDSKQKSGYLRNTEYFRKYIKENLVYPIYAEKNNITDRVFVQFVITETGKICNLKVLRSSGNLDLNMEALRVISESPLWMPGKQRKVAVAVSYTFPITFTLN